MSTRGMMDSIYETEIVRNDVKLGILYCMVNTGHAIGGSLGDCRSALLKGRKYQMVKTQTEDHDR